MIYIVCDMNCNNFGNYFRVIGLERELKTDKSSYIESSTYYPKRHCYRVKLQTQHKKSGSYKYSKAIDILIPEDYIRWMKNRFGGLI